MDISAEELHELVTKINGHDARLASLDLSVYGNKTMELLGLAARTREAERQIDDINGYIREQKLLMRVATGLLTALTAGGGILAAPKIFEILSKAAGG